MQQALGQACVNTKALVQACQSIDCQQMAKYQNLMSLCRAKNDSSLYIYIYCQTLFQVLSAGVLCTLRVSRSTVGQWLSARLKLEGLQVRASPEVLAYVFEQDPLSSA